MLVQNKLTNLKMKQHRWMIFSSTPNYLLNQLATFGEVMVEICYVRCFTTKISSFCSINLNLERLAPV